MSSVKVSERVAASAESVWDLLGDFGGITRYSAGVESCTVQGSGVGAVRTIRLPGGLELQERLGLPVDEMALQGTALTQRRPITSPRSATTPPRVPLAAHNTQGNLPAALDNVVGRLDELAELRGLVEKSRLVTLAGIGGIGKTTLATHAARELAPHFRDGAWLVDLADLRDGALLIDTAAGPRRLYAGVAVAAMDC